MTDLAQQAAITHVSGPCLVIAGPGAGKTHVLVRRIAFLTESASIPPSQLMVITFTRAAAKEMQKRYRATVPPQYSGVTFGTFHSIFFHILKRSGQISSSALIDDRTHRHILIKALRAAGVDDKRTDELLSVAASRISYIKNTDNDIDAFEPVELSHEEFYTIYQEYEKGKRRLGLIDFDDMLVMTRELFLSNPSLLDAYREHFKYYLVDEAQDMNGVQYEILRLMAKGKDNIFLVGDEDQSIYSFRGAQPKLFLGFTRDYPNAKTVMLSKNYRCDIKVVECAKRLIVHNSQRYDKELAAAGDAPGKLWFMYCSDRQDEAMQVTKLIQEEKARFPQKSIAVLYRNHSQSVYISKALVAAGFDPNGKKLRRRWQDNYLVSCVMDYIRAAVFGPETETIIRVMNNPNRYLPREGLAGAVVDYDKWKSCFYDDEEIVKGIDALKNDIEAIKRLNSFAAVSYILYRIGCKSDALKKGEYDRASTEKLISLAKQYPDKAVLLEEAQKEKEKKGTKTANEKTIYLFTYHGSKGLEFDHVYLIDVNEGITPSLRAATQESIEEERRMFYVALTRAKHEITIASLTRLGRDEAYPSRFIKELAKAQSGISSSNSSKVSETSAASSSESILSSTGVPSEVSK